MSVGIRLETKSAILAPLTDLTPDPRLSMQTQSGMFRTYAFAKDGTVSITNDDGLSRITVKPQEGSRTGNTSFALLWQPETPPAIGNESRSPGASHLDDVRPGLIKNAHLKHLVPKTLTGLIPTTEVHTHWPNTFWKYFDAFLQQMEGLAPGILSPSTVIYSPAIEPRWSYQVDETGLTDVPGLSLAGDGAGISQGAMAAAVSGVAAGRGIRRSLFGE